MVSHEGGRRGGCITVVLNSHYLSKRKFPLAVLVAYFHIQSEYTDGLYDSLDSEMQTQE